MKSKPTIPKVLHLVHAYRDSKWQNGIGGSLKAVFDGKAGGDAGFDVQDAAEKDWQAVLPIKGAGEG